MRKLCNFIIMVTVLELNITIVYGENGDLIKKLGNVSNIEREKAVEQIIEKRTEAISDLIVALGDADWQIRASALNILGQMEVTEAMTEIINLLKDNNKIVKVSAIWALGKIKDEGAISELKEIMLNDPEGDCRMAATFSLGMLGNKNAIPFLKQALEDEDKRVQLRAAGSLGRLGEDSGHTIAIKEVENRNTEIKGYAIEAIGLIGKKESISILNTALNDSHTGIQARAKVALKQIELKSLSEQGKIDYLENSLKDKQVEVREWAVRSLFSQVEKEEAKEKLIKAAKDETNPDSENIRRQLLIKGIKID